MMRGWGAGLVVVWSSVAFAQGVPLVSVDVDAGGAAPAAESTPAVPLVTPAPLEVADAGGAAATPVPATEAVPLVVPPPELDAGPPAPPPVPQPQPQMVDAGAPAAAPALDAGSAQIAPSPAVADAGPPALAAATGDGGAPAEVNPNFIKGELSDFLGANRIAVETTRVGAGLGVSRISGIIYVLVEPRLDIHYEKFGIGLAAPLNFEVFDTHLDPNSSGVKFIGTRDAGKFRKEDYTTARDYARVLQYVTYGHKEDHLYIDIGQIYAHSIGHGEIMRRYQPDIDLDKIRIAAEVDAYNDYGGAELLTNDVLSWDILGGIGFVKPLSFVSEDPIARSLSIGVTWATDRTAPDQLNINHGFPGSGLNGCDCRPVLVKDASGRYVLDATTHPVSLFGLDAEVKVVKTDDIDIKPYFDVSHLVSGDSGVSLGVLGRFNFGGSPLTPTQAVRLILEGRYLGDRYRPSYFDTFYEVDKYIFLDSPKSNLGEPTTQQQAVLAGLGSRMGYYTEASYGIRGWIGTTVALEGDSAGPAKNLVVHAELPKLFILQIFASYYKRGFTDFNTLTELDKNSLALAGARLELLPILYLNARAYQTFQLDQDNTHTYQTTRGVEGDVELGYQF